MTRFIQAHHTPFRSCLFPSGNRNIQAGRWRKAAVGAVLLVLLSCGPAAAQSDSLAAPPQRDTLPADIHTPRGALWRAAVLPGWGQVYNRQYIKAPVVYLGLGGITAFALYMNSRYLFYRHAYLYKSYQEAVASNQIPSNPFLKYEEAYARLEANHGPISSSSLRPVRDSYRRNRDLSYLGIGLFYGLTVLDAYVSAHLFNFDVGEDLTVSFYPAPEGWTAAVRYSR